MRFNAHADHKKGAGSKVMQIESSPLKTVWLFEDKTNFAKLDALL
jgi:hypothetical protein